MMIRKALAATMATAALSATLVATDDVEANAALGCDVTPSLPSTTSGGVWASAIGDCDKTAINLTIQAYMTMSGKKVGKSVSNTESYTKDAYVAHGVVPNPAGSQEFCVAAFLYKNGEIADKQGECVNH